MNEALCAVLSIDLTTRQRGEAFLRNAQSCDPHFFSALLMASDPATGLPEAARLLAATQLKNEAVRHWKSGAAHSPERLALRTALATRLTQPEPSLRVGAISILEYDFQRYERAASFTCSKCRRPSRRHHGIISANQGAPTPSYHSSTQRRRLQRYDA